MTAVFSPPAPTGPAIPKWQPPKPTNAQLNWAELKDIDLSLLDSPDPEVVNDLVKLTATATREDGFLYLTNYGISLDQLHRQFDLAQYLHSNISDEDKERLLWDPSSGLFAGFKRRLGGCCPLYGPLRGLYNVLIDLHSKAGSVKRVNSMASSSSTSIVRSSQTRRERCRNASSLS